MTANSSEFSLDHIEPDSEMPDPVIHRFDETALELMECASRPEFLSSDRGTALTQAILRQIEDLDIEVLSYDVFDTLLLRNNKPEALRYLEMSQLALEKLRAASPDSEKINRLTSEDLLEMRNAGMRLTYRTRPMVQGCREGHIDQVISAQCNALGLSEEHAAVLLEAEISYEVENLTLNPVLTEVARAFQKNGGKVILVSDMYLPATAISELLTRQQETVPYDLLYSSADGSISKRSGKIFPKLSDDLSVASDKFLHLGDSWIGDVKQPRKHGWHSQFFPVSRHEHFEREQRLVEFLNEMDERGIETRSWAKL